MILGIVFSIVAVVMSVKAFLEQNTQRGERKVLFFNNKGSILDFIPIVVSAAFLIVILLWSRNVWADIPYAINKDFMVTTGVVVGHNAGGSMEETRGFQLQDFKTGQVLNLTAVYTPIRKGEVYEVVYLPHTKVGAIVQKFGVGEYP